MLGGKGAEHGGDDGAERGDGRDANHGNKGQQQAVLHQRSASSSRANLVEPAVRGLVMEISPDGVDRVKGNKTPPTVQILLARLLKRMKVEFNRSKTLSI